MTILIDNLPAIFTLILAVLVYLPNSFWVGELHQDNENF